MQWTNEIKITIGKVPSLNAFYSSKHWTFRKREKDKWKEEIERELQRHDITPHTDAKVHIRCNYRYDIDNSIMAAKFICDSLVDLGFIPDDSPKHLREIKLVVDKEIPKDTAIATIFLR